MLRKGQIYYELALKDTAQKRARKKKILLFISLLIKTYSSQLEQNPTTLNVNFHNKCCPVCITEI
jgi:hypothetical protein